jgi:uncharacterized membrane protein
MLTPPLWQRLLAALGYLLPWSAALPFGQSLFHLFPILNWGVLPALPVLLLQKSVPFGGFVLFLVLFLAVARNPRVPYLIRFHVLQAILIDIVLMLVSFAFEILNLGGGFVGRTLANTILLGTLLLVLTGLIQSLRGQETDIPTVSEAVRMQL